MYLQESDSVCKIKLFTGSTLFFLSQNLASFQNCLFCKLCKAMHKIDFDTQEDSFPLNLCEIKLLSLKVLSVRLSSLKWYVKVSLTNNCYTFPSFRAAFRQKKCKVVWRQLIFYNQQWYSFRKIRNTYTDHMRWFWSLVTPSNARVAPIHSQVMTTRENVGQKTRKSRY